MCNERNVSICYTTVTYEVHTFNIVIRIRKIIMEGSLDQVLFAAELVFPKILVLRLPQNSSNVNIECAGK